MNLPLIPESVKNKKRKPIRRGFYEIFNTAVQMYHPYCPNCQQRIYGEFHIGHIISVYNGGKNVIENFVAQHPHCNRGTENLDVLIASLPEEIYKEVLIFHRSGNQLVRCQM